jgi:serine/threonine protein kinase
VSKSNEKSNDYPVLSKGFDYISMEYCHNGDLFELVKRNGKINESLVKYIFGQVLNGVEFLHSKAGVAHLDLKLENILIGNHYELKLCDFGFFEETKSRVCKNRGTHGYRAPETYFESNEGYEGTRADIFSLGVILFIMIFGVPPFCMASKEDPLYRLFYRGANSSKYFLRLHHATKQRYAAGEIDLELVDLLFQLLDENPQLRPKSVNEIR